MMVVCYDDIVVLGRLGYVIVMLCYYSKRDITE